MDKAIIFGASKGDKRTQDLVRERYEIILYSDNDRTKWGSIDGIPIIPPEKILRQSYDKIVIASITATDSIRQ